MGPEGRIVPVTLVVFGIHRREVESEDLVVTSGGTKGDIGVVLAVQEAPGTGQVNSDGAVVGVVVLELVKLVGVNFAVFCKAVVVVVGKVVNAGDPVFLVDMSVVVEEDGDVGIDDEASLVVVRDGLGTRRVLSLQENSSLDEGGLLRGVQHAIGASGLGGDVVGTVSALDASSEGVEVCGGIFEAGIDEPIVDVKEVEGGSPVATGADDVRVNVGLGFHGIGEEKLESTAVPVQVGHVPERREVVGARKGREDTILHDTVAKVAEGNDGRVVFRGTTGVSELRSPDDTVKLGGGVVGGIGDGVVGGGIDGGSKGAVELEDGVHLSEVGDIKELSTKASLTREAGFAAVLPLASRRTSPSGIRAGAVILGGSPEARGSVAGVVILVPVIDSGDVDGVHTGVRVTVDLVVLGILQDLIDQQHLSLQAEGFGGRQITVGLDAVETPVDEGHVGNDGARYAITSDKTEDLQRRVVGTDLGVRIDGGNVSRVSFEEEVGGTVLGEGTSVGPVGEVGVLDGGLSLGSVEADLVEGLHRSAGKGGSVDASVHLAKLLIGGLEDQEIDVVARVEASSGSGSTLPQGVDNTRNLGSHLALIDVVTEVSSEDESVSLNTGVENGSLEGPAVLGLGSLEVKLDVQPVVGVLVVVTSGRPSVEGNTTVVELVLSVNIEPIVAVVGVQSPVGGLKDALLLGEAGGGFTESESGLTSGVSSANFTNTILVFGVIGRSDVNGEGIVENLDILGAHLVFGNGDDDPHLAGVELIGSSVGEMTFGSENESVLTSNVESVEVTDPVLVGLRLESNNLGACGTFD